MAAAVLAFVVAAITQAVAAGQAQSHQILHEVRAVSLAEAMMEEVLAAPYEDPDGASSEGPDSGENSRDLFDNADDWDGYTESPGTLADHAGAAYPEPFQVFTRSVTAKYQTVNLPTLGQCSGLQVVVTVRDSHDRAWTISRFVPEPAP